MSLEIKAPVFPESIAEGSISAWHKQPGDGVRVDEKIADIETDKVVLEVAAPATGTIDQIFKQEGETVQAGELIAVMTEGAAGSPGASPTTETLEPEPTPPRAQPPAPAKKPPAKPPAPAVASAQSTAPPPPASASPGLGPAARKLAREEGIDPAAVRGSGPHGRVTKSDIAEFAARQARQTASPPPDPDRMEIVAEAPPTAPLPSPPPTPSSAPAGDGNHRVERKPMSRLRARIAERLVEAQHTAAILTTFNEIDMKPVFELRARHKDAFEKRYGVRLGFMSFFVKAAVEALRRFPAVNGSIEGNDLVYHHYYDIGIAVSSPRGLVVPILRGADRMSFAEIEESVRDYGVKAKGNQLSLEDLQGGTFTISNGGVFGSMLSTPILNPPQSGILGLHAIKDRPVAVNGTVEIRPVMYVALSYDHRIIDGREAVSFLVVIKEVLEDPARLLIQI